MSRASKRRARESVGNKLRAEKRRAWRTIIRCDEFGYPMTDERGRVLRDPCAVTRVKVGHMIYRRFGSPSARSANRKARLLGFSNALAMLNHLQNSTPFLGGGR